MLTMCQALLWTLLSSPHSADGKDLPLPKGLLCSPHWLFCNKYDLLSSPLLVSLCLATICAWNSQLPGYHPKQSSNFTSLPHYACPESSSLQAEPTSLFLLCWDVLSMFKVSVFQLSSNWPPLGLFTIKVILKYQRLLWPDACAQWHIFNRLLGTVTWMPLRHF